MRLIIRGGRLVLPDRTELGDITVENGEISRIDLYGATDGESEGGGDRANLSVTGTGGVGAHAASLSMGEAAGVGADAAGWPHGEAARDKKADIVDWSVARPANAGADDAEVRMIEAAGQYVLPGLIDLHCDAIEKEAQPRPNTLFPLQMAFMEFERKLPIHGITTMYHSLSLGIGLSLRGDELLTRMIEVIRSHREVRSVIRNRIHLRYEISHLAGYSIIENYVRERAIDYLSFMDHSPGQGQYREPGSFERYVMKNQGIDIHEVQAIVEDLTAKRERIDWSRLQALGELAKRQGITIASHDDDTPERVDDSKRLGAAVSEFPITLHTAKYAAAEQLYVCLGAPNVVRGASHDRNLSAIEAISAGAGHILCSDYHPSALLIALFKLADEGIMTLPEAVAMATVNPAKAVRADNQIGSIAVGKQADLIIVDRHERHPWVTHTIVGGKLVYSGDIR